MNAFSKPVEQFANAEALVRAALAGAMIVGPRNRPIDCIAAVAPGCEGALSFCDPGAAVERVSASRSSVIIVANGERVAPGPHQTLIAADDPRLAFIRAVEWLVPSSARTIEPAPGVDAGAELADTVRVAPSAAIGGGVRIGRGSRVGPGAVIYPRTTIGEHCVIGPGTVIGWVGLAYHRDAAGTLRFMPHLAGVHIGDRVDIGANCCLCQGILSDTTIGNDAKLGSLVYVGHGATVGEGAWISAASSIAGHAHVGDAGLVGIGTTLIDNVTLGTATLVGAGSVVTRGTADNAKVAGVPAESKPTLRRFGPTPR
jgi:UDP-3-O-[3-hydroxymyristoyl] glucosamine N-acyltransferase